MNLARKFIAECRPPVLRRYPATIGRPWLHSVPRIQNRDAETGEVLDVAGNDGELVVKMDNWNRTRYSKQVQCPACREKDQQQQEAGIARDERSEALHSTAKELATDRYLDKWLALYSGLTKKEAWERYTGG